MANTINSVFGIHNLKRFLLIGGVLFGFSSIHAQAARPFGGSGRYINGMDVDCCSVAVEIVEYNRSGTRIQVADRWAFCAGRGMATVWIDDLLPTWNWVRLAQNSGHCVLF